jgi:hypothetical protein
LSAVPAAAAAKTTRAAAAAAHDTVPGAAATAAAAAAAAAAPLPASAQDSRVAAAGLGRLATARTGHPNAENCHRAPAGSTSGSGSITPATKVHWLADLSRLPLDASTFFKLFKDHRKYHDVQLFSKEVIWFVCYPMHP